MNPIINQMMNSMIGNNPLVQMYKTVMSAKDQNSVILQMAQTNPQLRQTLDYINQNGGNAEQLFYKKAQEKGVDIDQFLSNLRNQIGC